MKKVDENLADFFKITSFGEDEFTYYVFDDSDYLERWEVFGFHIATNDLIALRLMRIDELLLEDEDFSAPRNTSPYVGFTAFECQKFVDFIETTVLQETVLTHHVAHFRMLDAAQLRHFHYPETLMSYGVGNFYQYTQNIEEGDQGKINLVSLPFWLKQINSQNSLHFFSLDQSHIRSEHFNLIRSTNGLGTITFTRDGLGELVSMLKERVREVLA